MNDDRMSLQDRRDLALRLRSEGIDVVVPDEMLADIPIVIADEEISRLIDIIDSAPEPREQTPTWREVNRERAWGYIATGFVPGAVIGTLAILWASLS